MDIVGHCPKCGAPIYAERCVGDTPPIPRYSCTCNLGGSPIAPQTGTFGDGPVRPTITCDMTMTNLEN